MGIEDTIKTLTKINQLIEQGIPNTITNPNELVDYVNDLYGKHTTDVTLAEILAYDEILTLTITLTIYIEEEFDSQKVRRNMEAKFGIVYNQFDEDNETQRRGVIWSYGRYDFVYEERSQNLKISHPYSHEAQYIKQVETIIKKMLSYAKDYLDEVKKSIGEDTTTQGIE